MPPIPRRTLLRAAQRIRDQYVRRCRPRLLPLLPVPSWNECVRLARQAERARRRGSVSVAERLRSRFVRELVSLDRRCHETVSVLESHHRPRPIPALRLIYDELAALPDEFEHVEICLRSGEVRVTTEPVVLEELDLGRFEIRLVWSGLRETGPQPYRVVALTARPPASGDETTHPHVRDERLCEGDARRPIDDALASGRLGDFFLIVAQTLHTYNAGSAFVSLDDWEGIRCADCDATVNSEEVSRCQRCETDCCSDCSRYCEGCDDTCCSQCSDHCADCGDSFCNRCLTACDECDELHCDDCLSEGLCAGCRPEPDSVSDEDSVSEATQPDSNSNSQDITDANQERSPPLAAATTSQPCPPQAAPEPLPSGPPVLANGVGEAAVSA